MARGRAEEFVLDFDEPAAAEGVDAAGPVPADRRRKIRGVPRPLALWAGVSVVLVLAGILTVPPPPPGPSWGVGPGWSSPPVEQWTVPLTVPAGELTSPTITAEHVLVVAPDRLDAYDRADGTLRWSVTDLHRCTVADAVVVCVSGAGVDARVAIVDTGGAVHELAVPGAASATLRGEDLVVLTEAGEAGYELALHAGLDPAQVRWSTPIAIPDAPAGTEVVGDDTPRVRVQVGDLVLLSTGDLYRAETGEQVSGSWSEYPNEDALLSWDGERGQLMLPHTNEVLDLPGAALPSLIDDGSSPAVAIMESESGGGSSDVVTWDGDVLWHGTSGLPVARLGDLLLVAGSGDSGARRVGTGTQLWSIPDYLLCPCRGDVSGLMVYAAEFGLEGISGARLLGLRPADGEVLWEIPLGDGARVADTDEAVAVLADGQLALYSRT
ncbi:PQQ-binding-like beta-propeller repeat protein [Occultella aeris]|uniref:Pyrrolo-quinoline quinone repeat domain-containing protein n=1 Tax=Occultella aeris TaxID=2761496 RepID=A0A7M4DEH6_9MICO|nr:PQQ-binding-like beta-propeller repeat protein [Occultella aeris]VZO35319.1 hypothetical protein HALOF300_00516 [Occultella aeris]